MKKIVKLTLFILFVLGIVCMSINKTNTTLPYDVTDSVHVDFHAYNSFGYTFPYMRMVLTKEKCLFNIIFSTENGETSMPLNVNPLELESIKKMADSLFIFRLKSFYDLYEEVSLRPANTEIDYILYDYIYINTFRHNDFLPWLKRTQARERVEIADLDRHDSQIIYDKQKIIYSPHFACFMRKIYQLMMNVPIFAYITMDRKECLKTPVCKGENESPQRLQVDDIVNVGLENYMTLKSLLNNHSSIDKGMSESKVVSLYLKKGNTFACIDSVIVGNKQDPMESQSSFIYKIKCQTGFYNYFSKEELASDSLIQTFGRPTYYHYILFEDEREKTRIVALIP